MYDYYIIYELEMELEGDGEIPAQLLSASVATPLRKAKGRKRSAQMELF
jgi:hypothetical protein